MFRNKTHNSECEESRNNVSDSFSSLQNKWLISRKSNNNAIKVQKKVVCTTTTLCLSMSNILGSISESIKRLIKMVSHIKSTEPANLQTGTQHFTPKTFTG